MVNARITARVPDAGNISLCISIIFRVTWLREYRQPEVVLIVLVTLDLDSQSSLRCFTILGVHILTGFVHRFDNFIQ